MIELTFDEWEKKYSPITDEEGSIKLWETYDEEFEEVWNTDRRYIWTLVEGDNGDWYITEGISYVNRLNYIICKNPRNLGHNFNPIKY